MGPRLRVPRCRLSDPGFADLGLPEPLVRVVGGLGYTAPTPIQRDAIPPLRAGRDLLGLAATGTGKTAAFALPVIEKITTGERRKAPRALVLAPTRELAAQVAEAFKVYGVPYELRVALLTGGAPYGPQNYALERGVDVVVATPGRANDHLRRGSLVLASIDSVVLDEADEMLDMGFQDDLEEILAQVPVTRQVALFSATFPRRLRSVAASHLKDPVRVEVTGGEARISTIREVAHLVRGEHKAAAVARLLSVEEPEAALVFCRRREDVDEMAAELLARGHRVEALHGGLSQAQRDRTLSRLRAGHLEVVVATDVAARGLDIDHLTHVIQADFPENAEVYVHRIGRTGRAGRAGTAIVLVEPKERRFLPALARNGKEPTVQPLPSADDLRTLQRYRVLERVRRVAEQGDLELWSAEVGRLLEGGAKLEDLAAAALQALHDATVSQGPVDEIPSIEGNRKPLREPRRPAGPPAPRGAVRWDRAWINVGKDSGVRPADVFGAILGETGLERADVGAIEVRGNFTMVDVNPARLGELLEGLNGAQIRGRKVAVRRDKNAPTSA